MAISKLPTRNVMLVLLFGGGILIFVLLSIFPNYLAYSNMNHEIEKLKNQIEEQKILSPIFTDLSEKATFAEPENLPFPQKAFLSKNETGNLSSIIQEIIQENDFTLESIMTDVGGLLEESGILKMSVEMTGDFMKLRNLILQLGSLPYLAHIESVQIDNFNDKHKILLKIWIAQEQ